MAKNTQEEVTDPRIVEIMINISRGEKKEAVGTRFNIEQLINIGKTGGLDAANNELNKMTSKLYIAANEKIKEVLKWD